MIISGQAIGFNLIFPKTIAPMTLIYIIDTLRDKTRESLENEGDELLLLIRRPKSIEMAAEPLLR